jgi:hypothetical protein
MRASCADEYLGREKFSSAGESRELSRRDEEAAANAKGESTRNDEKTTTFPQLHPRYIACDASCVAIATLECGPRRAEDNQRAFEKPVVEKTNARYHPRSRVLSALRARKAATRKYRFRLPQIPAIQGSLSRTRSSRPLPRGRARIPLKAAP